MPAESQKKSPPKFDRRGLLAGSAGAAGLLLLGAWGSTEGEPHLVRPPGSVPAENFLARCLRCDRCRSVCHTNVISSGKLSDGILSLRTPVMDFRLGFCDFCEKCAEVCPTGAIAAFDPETAKIGLAEVTDSCIALRTGACTKCHEACPYEAIDLDPRNRPIVNAEKCNGCGKCELICPSHVYQSWRGEAERGIVVRPLSEAPSAAEGGAK
ncbi:4Fe-4S dicluster domain-containing protein [Sutterella faecalis]|uniref:4Fe-4S dicluster domain-containing protein n=2 Tax=Sutterella TaxID=40544 RepID=A0AAI9SBI4_9BURK|nr:MULTISPECIES: 4Fe-4S dicluster domain-containing protein [Sutterella]KAB7649578.1 4Fe-4S dicluster domain-containing protein [Sutterella seckii]QDA55470.1 4Fe-4S dicluster domain-containing protein [Sutterella faecalis]